MADEQQQKEVVAPVAAEQQQAPSTPEPIPAADTLASESIVLSQTIENNAELAELCQDYVSLLGLSRLSQQGQLSAEETIESVLNRLDEFGEHLDYVRKRVLRNILTTNDCIFFVFC